MMNANYLTLAIVALVGYSFVAPLVKVASESIPILIVALVTNMMITIINLLLVLYVVEFSTQYFVGEDALYMYGAGLFLSVGFLSYLFAVSLGPTNVVVPIFGMFIVLSSLIGIVFLDETASLLYFLGLFLSAIGIVLVSTQQAIA